ncbi:MAG: DNA double-strand break repair nuclease NurA [Dehalococcoidia bacterium]|nr:DNA double-strand break repair nuclease NurA [Dehalococcoidia bacterium]
MLDLNHLAKQMGNMVEQLKIGGDDRRARVEKARRLMLSQELDFTKLQDKVIRSQKTSPFLLAGPVEPFSTCKPPISISAPFSIIATDGSQIDVDRHQSTRCYLINIGRVRLDYGDTSHAMLDSLPRLYTSDKDAVISNGIQSIAVEGPLLGIKRSVEECRHLNEMAAELPPTQPALAIIDGTLIMWQLSGNEYPDFVVRELLDNGFMKYLDSMRLLAQKQPLSLASYISFPRSMNVVNTLRIGLCPHELADCARYCGGKPSDKRHCDELSGVRDQDLFLDMLRTGERSAVFISRAKIVREKYGEHAVYFFYLKLEDEIARVEIPQWIAQDELKLDQTHALVFDQCLRGSGYPIALSESHEQAVVSESDKNTFRQLLVTWLSDEHIDYTSSAKSRSKKTRWL